MRAAASCLHAPLLPPASLLRLSARPFAAPAGLLPQLQNFSTPATNRCCREAAQEDFEEDILPLLARHPGRLRPEALTLDNFHVAASLVASRAFGVDEWHGG